MLFGMPLVARAASGAVAKFHNCMSKDAAPHDESRIVGDLAAAEKQLVFARDGEIDTKSEDGNSACSSFLRLLTFTAERLRCEAADRSYRNGFTRNYRILFPDTKRRYRVDVLEACVEQLDSFYVNGSQFRLHAETLSHGQLLRAAWQELHLQLRAWSSSGDRGSVADLEKIRATICAVDTAWARFEFSYIRELIKIEETARGTVVEAIECERRLGRLEEEHGQDSAQSREARQRFASSVARLNSVANTRRKGRSDLGAEVLEHASEILAQPVDSLGASQIIAAQVTESFEALREYFRHAQSCLERIDPYLCNNTGLVERLVDWEESWEVGNRYLEGALGGALCALARSLRLARDEEPAFAAMCEDCDAELFMVLPRIMWLAFLREPAVHTAFLQSVLPDAFYGTSQEPTDNLGSLLARHRSLEKRLTSHLAASGRAGERATAKLLRQRSITGDESSLACLGEEERREAQSFMLELERWSMAAQRRRPDDWNASVAVLLKVLAEPGPVHRELVPASTPTGKFRV